MNVHQTDCDIHFMTYVSQITVLYTLNSAVCPLCVNKTGRKKPQKRFKKKWTSFCILLYKRQFSTSSALACLPILQTDKWKSDVVRWFDQALSLHLTTGPCLELPSTGPRSLSPSVNHSAWRSGEWQLHTDDATCQHSSGSFLPLSLTRPLLVCFLAPFNRQRAGHLSPAESISPILATALSLANPAVQVLLGRHFQSQDAERAVFELGALCVQTLTCLPLVLWKIKPQVAFVGSVVRMPEG